MGITLPISHYALVSVFRKFVNKFFQDKYAFQCILLECFTVNIVAT